MFVVLVPPQRAWAWLRSRLGGRERRPVPAATQEELA